MASAADDVRHTLVMAALKRIRADYRDYTALDDEDYEVMSRFADGQIDKAARKLVKILDAERALRSS
jgi:hypothetical protein